MGTLLAIALIVLGVYLFLSPSGQPRESPQPSAETAGPSQEGTTASDGREGSAEAGASGDLPMSFENIVFDEDEEGQA